MSHTTNSNNKIVLIVGSLLALLLLCGTASAAWLDGYNYRQPITLTGGASGAQTNYTLQLNVTYNAHMQADFDDLRFTKADGTTLIDAWLESSTANYALVEVEFPTTPANGVDQTYYTYYNNSTAGGLWDITEAFVFGDNFTRGDGTALGVKWAEYGEFGDWEIKGNALYRGNVTNGTIFKNDFALAKKSGSLISETDIIVESRINITQFSGADQAVGISVRSNADPGYGHAGYSLLAHDPITRIHLLNQNIAWGSSDTTIQSMNEWWNYELQIAGTALKGKVWKVGTARPGAWNVESTFGTQASGYIGAKAYFAGTTEQYYDDFRVRKYAASPPTYVFDTEESEDTVAPIWGNQSQNVSLIAAGGSVLLSANGHDASGLDYAWLATNETGTWQNFTTPESRNEDYAMLTHDYIHSAECGSHDIFTAYSELTGDYSKYLTTYTPLVAGKQVAAFGWYFPGNNTWSSDHIVYDTTAIDANSLIVINATHWVYLYREIAPMTFYETWTHDSGVTWGSRAVSSLNTEFNSMNFVPIENDSDRVIGFGTNRTNNNDMYRVIYYRNNNTYSTSKYIWTSSGVGEFLVSKVIDLENVYYAFIVSRSTPQQAKYVSSTDLDTWNSAVATNIPHRCGTLGIGWSVDCDEDTCYAITANPSSPYRQEMYSINKSLFTTNTWTYRLNLTTINAWHGTLKLINSTHLVATCRDHTNKMEYGALVKTHSETIGQYGSPINMGGSSNWEWANFTWSNSDYNDATIDWKICFNDTAGLANCTDVMSFDIGDRIRLYADEYALINNWASAQTFAQIDANISNCVCLSWYNYTSGLWEAYRAGYTYNHDAIIPKNCSVFVFVDGQTTISATVKSGGVTIQNATWFYGMLPGSTVKTLTEIKTKMDADGLDVWALYGWNNATQAHTDTGSYSVSPNEGYAVYCNVTGEYTP